jgi:hypothetical protein
MKYYWSSIFNSGEFYYWKAEDEKTFMKLASKLYCGKLFDYGETVEKEYKRGRKGN